MAENYKHLYQQMKKMVEMYQDEVVPGLRKTIEEMEQNRVEVIRCEECKHWWKKNELCAHPKCRTGMVCVTEAPPNHYCSYGERKDNGS